MSRRTKVLGPAGGDASEEEMVLAELLAAAGERGLRACRGAYYRDAYGDQCAPEDAACCCAEGARMLSPTLADTMYPMGLIGGNDDRDREFHGKYYVVGAAFYEALGPKAES